MKWIEFMQPCDWFWCGDGDAAGELLFELVLVLVSPTSDVVDWCTVERRPNAPDDDDDDDAALRCPRPVDSFPTALDDAPP